MAIANTKDRIRQIPFSKLMVNPAQPRTKFEDEQLESLAKSIAANGLLQPVVVRDVGGGKFQLIAGERRCRACMLLGYTQISAIVKNCTLQESAVLALIENLQRQDLDLFEQAEGISRLIGYWGITQEEASVRLGMAQSTLANKLRLLRLSPAVQQLLQEYSLTERHARALLRLPDEQAQQKAAKTIAQKSMNAAQTDEYISALINNKKMKKPTRLFICKDVRLFINTIDKAVKTMEQAGLAVKAAKQDQGDYIEMTIRIPKTAEQKRTASPA